MPFYNAKVDILNTSTVNKGMALKLTSTANASFSMDANTNAPEALKPGAPSLNAALLSSSGDSTPGGDEENVRPSPAAGEPDQVTRPLSPQLKDVRAYEHERQRAKRAGEWALKRAKKSMPGGMAKTKSDTPGGKKGTLSSKAGSGGFGAGIGREDVDVEFFVGGRGGAPTTGMAALAVAEGKRVKATAELEPFTIAVTDSVSVSLSELVVSAQSKPKSKAKKSKSTVGKFGSLRKKGSKGRDNDGADEGFSYADEDDEEEEEEEFEWVPALRAVIALDEVDPHGRRDMEVDEPWECVGRDGEGEEKEGEGGKKGLSYAAVVGGMHLD